ncbi:hypothetical protein SAMN05216229_104268 [Geopseudomonas sagittaria]|uniref:Uncharacterized protein n=1 Tax=Geopseudomonas sagittaria TaxID=1135990 RepID=A0A1I5S9T7_9GAMM|nr:hypothetical protein [Pseudomonas sagittaria]SFP67514.1 hypothetical protein SAMN05216229_104268 [Pseudomonas sagittaria]
MVMGDSDDHIALSDIYPDECERHGYRVVGLAQRRVIDTIPAGEPFRVIKERTRDLLQDPQNLELLRQAAAEMSDE